MAILKFGKDLTPVVFREGITGREVQSQITGEIETRHFVNQYRDTSDTIFLPTEAQRILETINPRNSETVLISKEKLRGKWEWHLVIAQEQAQRPAQAPAAPRPAPQPKSQNLLDHSSREHALNYPPQPPAHRPEANMMAGALLTAIEAAQIAEQKTGMHFDQGDIRAMAISMYIEACKQRAENGRRAA